MHKIEEALLDNMIIYNDKQNINVHPTDIPLDSNNNETPEHGFSTCKKYDSGLGILSPQSDDSFTITFPTTYLNNNVTDCTSTTNSPVLPTVMIGPKTRWSSLCDNNGDSLHEMSGQNAGTVQLKTLGSNNNMSASIVIYENDGNQLRHINFIDLRPKHKSNVRRSNTFSNDKNTKHKSYDQREMWRSTDNLTFAETRLSSENLCNHLSQGSLLSDNTIVVPDEEKCRDKGVLESSSRILQRLISTLCCRRDVPARRLSDEDIVEFVNYPDWKFSLDEFDDITYFSSGAQGTIYTAILKDVKVALKKVKDKRDDIHIERLLALNHRNIITFIGICEEAPNYLVMEFCSQGQLFHWLRRDLQISPQDVRRWAYQICDGMTYLHKNDIIHRDLKSPNILITDDNVLKIIDFEFSKDCCENKTLNSFVGTMAWMAPEILREETHTKKVDVWSYGVVVWEMITREIPYFGIERLSILFGVGNNCLSLPLCGSIPIQIKELLCDCWEQSSSKRPSFEAILEKLNYYFYDLEGYSQEKFTAMQLEWKHEIESQFQDMNKEKISISRVEAELIRRRTKELHDAKNIKELYNEKLMRADKLIALLNRCLNAVRDERKKNDSEWKLIQKFKQSASNRSQSPLLTLDSRSIFKKIKFNSDKLHMTLSPIHSSKKDTSANRHSMLEQEQSADRKVKVRRKHSVPIFRERNLFLSSKTKADEEINSKNRKEKVRSKKASLSLETVSNDPLRSGARNPNDLHKRAENRWKRNSSPCKNMGYLALPSPNKTSVTVDDFSGTVNHSFQGSCDSFTNVRELQEKNSNLVQIAFFGQSASITDLNKSRENSTVDTNIGPSQSLFHRSLLEESISECPQLEESKEDIHEYGENDVVVIRRTSGRNRSAAKRHSFDTSLKDSLDVSMLTCHSQTAHSLIEKETIAQRLIKPFDFLAHVGIDPLLEAEAALHCHDTGDSA